MPQRTPKSKNRKVTFTRSAPNAQSVSIAGDFNQWNPHATPMSKMNDGTWQIRLRLTPGSHQFKYVVDGKWCCEPGIGDHCTNGRSETIDNAFGTKNYVVMVK